MGCDKTFFFILFFCFYFVFVFSSCFLVDMFIIIFPFSILLFFFSPPPPLPPSHFFGVFFSSIYGSVVSLLPRPHFIVYCLLISFFFVQPPKYVAENI